MRRTIIGAAVAGAAIIAASVGLNRQDDISRYVTSTEAYNSAERIFYIADRSVDRLLNYGTYSEVNKEFLHKIDTTDGRLVFLQIGASWCVPCKGLDTYLEGIANDYPCVRFERIELDGGIENSETSRNCAIMDAMVGSGMISGGLDIPMAFIINNGDIESCMRGYRGDGAMRKCESKEEVLIKEKLKKCQ